MSRSSTSSHIIRWAWVCLFVVAAGSRLGGLGDALLSPDETRTALAAWDAVNSGTWPATADSTLLMTGQVLLFALLGPSTVAARLLPALAGALLVGIPLLWRKQLGEVGALVAGGLILVSPLSLFAARNDQGTTLAVLGGSVVVTVALQALVGTDRDARGSTRLLAAGLALGLTGGAAFYDIAVAGAAAWYLLRRSVPESLHDSGAQVNQSWKRSVMIGLGLSVMIATALGMHWSGWAGAAGGAAAWLREWQTPEDRDMNPLGMVALYEPLLLMVTITGLGMLAARTTTGQHALQRALALWAAVTTLLVAVRPGSTPGALSAGILPLALLAGAAAEYLWTQLPPGALRWLGLHGLTSALFWAPGLLALAQHANGSAFSDQVVIIILGGVVLVALQVMLVLIFLMHLPPKYVWRGAWLGMGMILLFLQTSFAAGLSFVRSDSANEPALQVTASHDLENLRQALQEIAVTRNARTDSLEISLIDSEPDVTALIRWTLRDFDGLRVTSDWQTEKDSLVISPEIVTLPTMNDTVTRSGARFVTLTRAVTAVPVCRQWDPLECRDTVAWYLYRMSPVQPTPTYAILWQTN